MSLPIDNLSSRQAIINNDYGQWGYKINNIQQELADGINELYEDISALNTIDGGNASSTFLLSQSLNGGGA